MRVFAILATLVAAAGLGLAAEQFLRVWRTPVAGDKLQLPVKGAALQATDAAAASDAPVIWPAVFGQAQKAEPQPPAPEPAAAEVAPRPPAPPLDSLGYMLKGMVSTGDDRWAIVAHPTGVRLLRVGDTLSDDLTVTAIDARGLWVVNGSGEKELLAFPE